MVWWSGQRFSVRCVRVFGSSAVMSVVACGGASRGDFDGAPKGGAGGTATDGGHHAGGVTAAGGRDEVATPSGHAGARPTGAGGANAGNGHGGDADNLAEGGADAGQAGAELGGSAGKASGGRAGSTGNAGTTAAGAGQGGMSSLGAIEPAVKAYCDAVSHCCSPSEVTSLDACEARYAAHSQSLASLRTGASSVDPGVLAQCEEAFGGPDQCNMNVVWDACKNLFAGTRALNEPCGNGWECDRSQGEVTCLVSDTSTQNALGVCTPAPRAALGEACVSTCESGQNCASTTYGIGDTYSLCFEDDGLYCAYVSPGSVCKAVVPLGAPCVTGEECGHLAYCPDTTCEPLAALGEACGDIPCRHELTCGPEMRCIDPKWADAQGCTEYPPLP